MHLFLFTNSAQRELVSICTHRVYTTTINFPWVFPWFTFLKFFSLRQFFNSKMNSVIYSKVYAEMNSGMYDRMSKNWLRENKKFQDFFFYEMMFLGPKVYITQMCEVHLQHGNSTTKWWFYQGCNAMKVNCGRVYSAYILKPVLFGGICKQE